MNTIDLRFVGKEGSMGLTNGRIYRVRVTSKDHYIWVSIPNMFFGNAWQCPYSSPEAFAANWKKPFE